MAISIDAVPLQFGSSQITRLTVNFKYERHQIVHRDIRGFLNIQKGEVKRLNDQELRDGTLLNSDFADNLPVTA